MFKEATTLEANLNLEEVLKETVRHKLSLIVKENLFYQLKQLLIEKESHYECALNVVRAIFEEVKVFNEPGARFDFTLNVYEVQVLASETLSIAIEKGFHVLR